MKSCKEINRSFAVKKTLNLSSLVQFISRKRFENESRMARERLDSNSVMARERLGSNSVMTRERLGSVVSRFCLASLICLCMLTVGVGNAWGGKITLTQSSLELTGSYTSGTKKTVDGVTFVYTNLMKNSDNIQAKASTGVIYNKTAMPGNITEIKVTHSGTARSTTVCYGTSSQPTTNETNFSGSKTISVSGSNKYFKITRGDNAAYWTSIEITYADAVAYTITATRNNDSYGTVSVTGTTITATPAAGYRVMAGDDGYAVTSGTATVVNNGDNTFTVTPSSNCTVQINFESKGCTDHGASSITSSASTSYATGPINEYYKYSTRQILYTKSDLGLDAGKKGTIKSIYFKYAGSSAMTKKTSVDIYLANTPLTALASGTAVPYSAFTKVYSGPLNFTAAGWQEFSFNVADFDYDGAGCLAVMIDDNSYAYDGTAFTFNVNSSTGAQIYKHSDTTNEDPSTINWSSDVTATSERPNAKFCIQEADMVQYTVNWYVNGSLEHSQTGYPGTTLTGIPTPDESDCDGSKVFVGWYTSTYSHATDAPDFVSPTTIPNGGANYYAVFAITETTPSTSYSAITSSLESNKYVIAYSYNGGTQIVLKNTADNSNPSNYLEGHNLSLTASKYANPDAAYIWELQKQGDGSYYIYNRAIEKYVNATTTALTLSTTPTKFTITYDSGNSRWTIQIKDNTSYYVHGYVSGSDYDFRCSTSGSGDRYRVYLYKNESETTYSDYATSCAACTADPTVGNAALSGTFNSSSIGVTCPSIGAGSNCAINDYGFVWKAGGAPSSTSDGTKVQVGTNNQSTEFNGTLTGSFNTSTTYYVKAYATNNGDHTTLSSTALVLTPRSITFNSNGGSSVAQIFVNSGSVAAQPANPTKDGYGFEGWFTDNGTFASPVDWSAPITSNQNYYAKWGAVHYTITYDHGTNGTGSISAGDKTHGEAFTLSSETFTREGYTQDGWSTSDGGDKAYELGGSYTANAAITLYPHWTINNYTVSWSVNGSTWSSGVTDANNNADYNTSVSAPTAPTSSDCDDEKVFVGWTDVEYEDEDDAPAVLFTGTSPAITENTTFYAVFAEASSGGGGGTATSITSYEDGDYYLIDTRAEVSGGYFALNGAPSSGAISVTDVRSAVTNNGTTITLDLTDASISDAMKYRLTTVGDSIHIMHVSTSTVISQKVNDTKFETTGNRNWTITKHATDNRFTIQSWFTSSGTKISCLLMQYSNWNGSTQVLTLTARPFNSVNMGGTAAKAQNYMSGYVYLIPADNITYSNYTTTCCQQPATQLSMSADKTELVGTGLIELSLAGGNGEDITWSCRDEADANCDALLSSTSNSGATFTVSSPAATTKTYTVQALQPEKDLDGEGIVCGKRLTIEITVKTQWTITFKTTDESVLTTYSTTTVTDGDTYTFPDLSDDYTCETNYSFAGWKAANTDGAPEYAAGSSATATENTTWYAVWMHSTGTTTITRDKYVRMTNGQSIAANDVVVVAYVGGGVALKQMTEDDEAGSPITVDFSADKSYLTFAPETAVMQLKALWHDDDDDDLDGWLLQDNTADFRLTYAGDKGGTLYYTDESGWFWDITITAQNNAVIEDTETGYDYSLQYNTTRNVFAFYSSSQKMVQLYRKNGTVSIDVPSAPTYSVNNMHCTNGATIRANGGQWITSAKDQKVRITVPVTAKNFETSGKQIIGSSDNAHFAVSVASHTIPSDKSESAPINVTIEYTPAEANVIETANITLTTGAGADDATRVIEVNGRSLPDEFVIMTQKESKWQALPADMFSGASTYEPTQVYPNGGLTLIPAAPYTAIYSAREVAASRYEAAGGCMRLVGNNNKCLWANGSNGLTTIQNFAQYGSTNGSNYEWLLYTEDGEQYTIANPAHPEYATGRQLGIYALKYGLYKTSDVFYLLPVGCSNMPGNVQITPRRVDATFSWETNASSVTIDIYTNEAMTEGHQTANVSEVPYLFTGLAERTNYWYKLTPDGNTECAVTGSFSTTGPIIDIVEWQENAAVIFVDKDEAVNPRVVIDGEVEHGQGGVMATNIFFSKYFEAEGYAKMLAIFNGTGNAISLADVTIQQRSTGSGYTPFSLAPYGKTAGWIQPGEEIILFNSDPRDGIMKCAVSDPTYPTWNNVENKNLEFGGKGTVRLFKGGKCIDIIGAMAAAAEAGDIDNYDKAPLDGTDQPSWGDKPGFTVTTGDNYNTHDVIENNYGLSTNRCLLIRQNWVTSGDSAVLNNYGDFKTLGTYTDANSKTHKGEWAGLQVPTATGGEEEYIHTCEGFQEVGKFDYNKYYKEYTNITKDKYLNDFTKNADGTYTITLDYMRQYACLNLKFQLTNPANVEDVLTEQTVQVPIVVKDARNSNDTLFNNIIKEDDAPHDPMIPESIERCKTCNVVILGTGTLTKAADGATGDVPQMGNLKIYPGGKLVVPSSTNFTVNSLAFRRQEDEVSMANIQGGLTINHENSVFLDVRIDPSSWHYIALPNNCRVGDITWADGTPAKVNADYLLAWYDGEKRATDKKGGWTSITDNEFILKTGIGYIVALPGSGNIKRELRFPMGNDLIEAEDDNKAITELHAWGGNNDELRPNHKGWNMIGNPYLLTYNNTAGSTGTIMTDPLVVGKLVEYPNVANWDGSWVYDPTSVSENLRYIVAPVDNGWSGYAQTTINDMKPFTSYFVQIGGAEPTANRTVTFKAAGVPRSVIRRAPQEYGEEDNHPVFYGIELTAPNNEKDRTALLISNDFTDDYDMMDDLAKQRGDYYKYYPYPVLASRNNEGEMAFNALPDTSAATVGVPLNYYAAQAGTHTIATDFRYDLEEVKSAMLYDATNNTYTDLLTQNYEFTAAKGENTNRFTLYVRVERKKAPNQETDVDNILDGKLSLVTIGKTLVLSGLTGAANVYVYDMSGKLLSRDQAGNGIWRTTVPATGVYFVRVDSANGQQTLRSIVK